MRVAIGMSIIGKPFLFFEQSFGYRFLPYAFFGAPTYSYNFCHVLSPTSNPSALYPAAVPFFSRQRNV